MGKPRVRRDRFVVGPPDLLPELPNAILERSDLRDDLALRDLHVTASDIGGSTAASVDFSGILFSNVKLSESVLRRSVVCDARLNYCDASNLEIGDSTLTRVAFDDCKLTGARLVSDRLHDVAFVDCRLDLSVFRGSTARHLTFRDCNLDGSDFSDNQFESVLFVDCSFRDVSFSGNRFRHCEFRDCDLGGIRGVANLRGASMTLDVARSAAVPFAGELGIDIVSVRDDA